MTNEIRDDPIMSELGCYGSHERPNAFLDIFTERGGQTLSERALRFWPLVAEAWSGFDRIPHRDYEMFFRAYRLWWIADCMEPEARRFYDSLPPMITLYRGADRQFGKGLAWTLDMEIAKGFAQGHRGAFNPYPTIFSARVRKSSVAFVCVDRNESECVLFRPPRNMTLQDTAPHPWVSAAKGKDAAQVVSLPARAKGAR